MNKKIITIAEVVFALIFVILLALFMSTIITKGNSTNTQLIDTLETTGGTSLNSYDHATMKGEAVISAIRNVKSIGDGTLRLELDVYTIKSMSNTGTNAVKGQAYGYILNKSTDLVVFKAKDPTDKFYINPAADFHSVLCYNNNNVCIGIIFYQEGVEESKVAPAFDGSKITAAASTSGRNNNCGDHMYCGKAGWKANDSKCSDTTAISTSPIILNTCS